MPDTFKPDDVGGPRPRITLSATGPLMTKVPTKDSPAGEEGVSHFFDCENVRFIGITSDQESGTSSRVSLQGLAWLAST